MKKIRVGVLFGGKSTEHEVSIMSAKNIVNSIDKDKYEVLLIGIDKKGKWHLKEALNMLSPGEEKTPPVYLSPSDNSLRSIQQGTDIARELDVVFPILHGPFGEDGTVQGLLRLADIPFVGADVLGSAVGMDKDVMKRLLRDAGINIGDFFTLHKHLKHDYQKIAEALGVPFFIKPANTGSSIGVFKINSEKEFHTKIEDAFQYDNKVLAETFIEGRELECAIMGNEYPAASAIGEIIPEHDFYSYEAKYIDDTSDLKIPADLPSDVEAEMKNIAIEAYKVLCCEGFARMDFFLSNKNEVLLNEINTIPGFTNISMFPKLWEYSGVSQRELIDKLIQLAIDRHERNKKLKFSI